MWLIDRSSGAFIALANLVPAAVDPEIAAAALSAPAAPRPRTAVAAG